MENLADRLGREVCRHVPFHFSPCSTTDSRVLLGYCIVAAGIAALIVAFFCGRDRPNAGR